MHLQGPGNRGGLGGGLTLSRIRDLYSKNFENSQNIFFFSIGPPLGKNRSLVPVYSHSYSLVMKPKRCNFWRGISLISIVKGFSKIGLSAVTKGEIAISVKSFY